MRNLTDFAIRQKHERINELGDKLAEVWNRINWEAEGLLDQKLRPAARPMKKATAEAHPWKMQQI